MNDVNSLAIKTIAQNKLNFDLLPKEIKINVFSVVIKADIGFDCEELLQRINLKKDNVPNVEIKVKPNSKYFHGITYIMLNSDNKRKISVKIFGDRICICSLKSIEELTSAISFIANLYPFNISHTTCNNLSASVSFDGKINYELFSDILLKDGFMIDTSKNSASQLRTKIRNNTIFFFSKEYLMNNSGDVNSIIEAYHIIQDELQKCNIKVKTNIAKTSRCSALFEYFIKSCAYIYKKLS